MKLKRLSALLLSGVLAFSLSVPALAEETPALSPAEIAAQSAQYAMTYGGATAVQYAVWSDGSLAVTGSAGVYSKTENRALTDGDLYGIGSVSKVYTTAAAMKLVEAGKLDLDSPVAKYIPTFKMADERYKLITVRMLLNHSSGLMGSTFNDAMLLGDTDQVATDTLLSQLATQRLKADPGAFSVYCNDGFTLAELVVEAVSGQEFNTYVRESLLAPLGLENTFAPQDGFDTGRLIKTYLYPDETRAISQDTLGVVGCGGLYATASDLAAFGGALTGTDLLTDASTAAMANAEYQSGLWPADDAGSIAYGLGWDSVKMYPFAENDIQALAKAGDTQFYHAGLVVLPEYNMAAAVLTSGGVSAYNEMAAAQMLAALLAEQGVTVDQTPLALPEAAPAAMPAGLTALSGYYGNSGQIFQVAVTADGKLAMHMLNTPVEYDQQFTYYSDGSFRDPSGQALVKLVTEENEETYFYQKACGVLPGLGYLPDSQYAAQRLPDNAVTPEDQAAWDRLLTLPLLPVNMKYSSQMYLAILASGGEMTETVPGYVLGVYRIDSETAALNMVQIPGGAGRDLQDLTLYEEDGVTFMSNTQGMVIRDYSDMTALYASGSAYATIGAQGYARWFALDPKDAGKTMSVALPQEGGYTVYDAAGRVVSSSAAYGETGCVLPEGGFVVFAGAPGARFQLSFIK